MSYSLTWLPEVLKAAGLKVAPEFGWENRGWGDVGAIFGVICHHTATQASGNMPTLRVLINGRSDLPGPLAQLGLGRDGTYYVIAAGRCYHAGKGEWKGLKNGNTNFIGIEVENSGAQPYPEAQMWAYQRGVAAILRHIGRGAEWCIGHKEWAPDRKSDPIFSMNSFRAAVAAQLNDSAPLALIPAREPGEQGRLTLRRGSMDVQVAILKSQLQRHLLANSNNTEVNRLWANAQFLPASEPGFGPMTEAAVRLFQRLQPPLVPDGIVGPKTWVALT